MCSSSAWGKRITQYIGCNSSVNPELGDFDLWLDHFQNRTQFAFNCYNPWNYQVSDLYQRHVDSFT